jgi:hypothetical protein
MGPWGPAEVIFLVAMVAVPLIGIIDALLIPSSAFKSAGRSKRFWILIQILLGYLGAVIYFAAIRADVRFFMAPPHPDWEEDALSEGDATPVEGAIAVREEDALRERDATPQDSRDS